MFNENQFSLDLWDSLEIEEKLIEFRDIIIDRKSKYTVVWWNVNSKEDVKDFMINLNKDKYYRKSTHNSYAFIIKNEYWQIIEWKNDDSETWAWMCILRELQRENCQNMIIVVTRYFWGIHLNTDRFKNVIDATKYFIDKIKIWN